MRLVRIARVLALALSVGAAPAAACDAYAPSERMLGPERAEPLIDVASFSLDAGVARYRSAGPGSFVTIGNRVPFDPPLDFAGRTPVVRVRIEDASRLAGAELALFSRGAAFVFPVTVFVDESTNLIRSGDWIDLSLSFAGARIAGTPDRAAIDRVEWRTAERQEPGAPLSASFAGLFARRIPPAGAVSLTFDDGYASHHAVAARLLAEYGMRATAYVMPEQVGAPGYMTLPQLRELRDRYGWEVAAHHFKPFTDAPEGLAQRIDAIQSYLAANGFDAQDLAYPLGKYDLHTVLPLVRARFATARLASGGLETLPPADPHRLRAYNVVASTTPQQIREAVRRVREEHAWVILMFHFLVDEPQQDTQYAVAALREALAGIAAEGVAVLPVGEVWRRHATLPAAPDR